MDNGHFRPNDTYDANRRLILSSLPSNVTSQEGLFFNGSIGQEPNRVYATGMCIPGSTPQDCSDCDPTLCLVRYASTSFSGSGDLTPRSMVINGGYIASNKTEFKKTCEDLVARMIDVASTGKSTPLFSNNHYTANSASLTSSQNMYALMQCTPDVSSRDCENCLRQSTNDFHSCCALKRGTRILRPICFFRWELYDYSTASFAANFTVASSSPSHLPPVVVPEPADDQDNTIDTADSDISTPHSSQYDFKKIEVATNKFSRSNKLGEGGFGEVYKAWRLWRNVSPLELVDPTIGRNYQSNEVTRCIHIALLCVQDNPDDRPMLSTIILMLTSNTITLPLPRLPSCFPHSMNKLDQLSEGYDSSQFTGQRSVGYSGSDVTISDLEPR
ncbi:hypothetical protein Bca4012_087773 [Brassica carinata]